MIRRLRPAALALLLLAPGCAELDTLRNVATPTELYGLSPKSTFPDDLPEISAQLVVEDPTAHAAVDTDRIAVKPHPLRVQYFPGVRWVERAPLTVQRLLIESFENTDRLRSVGRSAVGLRADYTLSVDLREFQAELRRDDPEAPVTARVQLNLKIVKQPDGLIVGSRSFARRIPAESDEMLDVVIAFDTALGKVMRYGIEWALRRIDELEENDPRLLRDRLAGG